jgi:hypothetical protein
MTIMITRQDILLRSLSDGRFSICSVQCCPTLWSSWTPSQDSQLIAAHQLDLSWSLTSSGLTPPPVQNCPFSQMPIGCESKVQFLPTKTQKLKTS